MPFAEYTERGNNRSKSVTASKLNVRESHYSLDIGQCHLLAFNDDSEFQIHRRGSGFRFRGKHPVGFRGLPARRRGNSVQVLRSALPHDDENALDRHRVSGKLQWCSLLQHVACEADFRICVASAGQPLVGCPCSRGRGAPSWNCASGS
jgi:hypothetical protein